MHDSPSRHYDDRDGRDDDYDDLAALDFSPPARPDESDLDALDGYGSGYAEAAYEDGGGDAPSEYVDYLEPFPSSDEEEDGGAVPTFTVTNPPGTVSVTTFIDGRVHQIDLSPKVNTLTEATLADEIVVIARLATQDARAAQFAFMLEGMRLQGHDGVATRDFLQRDLDLPSPEQVAEDRAAVFAQRYAGRHE